MSSIRIIGGKRLEGELKIHGSKNAALPIIAATVLNKGITLLKNCPKIQDVYYMIDILRDLGCIAAWEGEQLYIDSSNIASTTVPEEYVREMRCSILFLGALLGRTKEVTIAFPGGCSIGKRPIDYHLDAMRTLNVDQTFSGPDQNIIHCKTSGIQGRKIKLQFPSVGTTQNIILATVVSEGRTIIQNAAMEPEVEELCRYLVAAGGIIKGIGTSNIVIEGVKQLHDVRFTLSSDRIVAGTYMVAIAASNGRATLQNCPINQLKSTIDVLRDAGCIINVNGNNVEVYRENGIIPIKLLKTKPYPGFPTDMQSQILTLLCLGEGRSIIQEEIFESRYQNIVELKKLGAKIRYKARKNRAVIDGVDKLSGGVVNAHDLRGGAALVIAGLVAEGTTIVQDITYIERGYEDICRDLSLLGGNLCYCSERLDLIKA